MAMSSAPDRFMRAHPCVAYPTVVSQLSKCATATPFYTSYLGGQGSITRIVVKTITTTTGGRGGGFGGGRGGRGGRVGFARRGESTSEIATTTNDIFDPSDVPFVVITESASTETTTVTSTVT